MRLIDKIRVVDSGTYTIEQEGLCYRGGKYWVEFPSTSYGTHQQGLIQRANFVYILSQLKAHPTAFTFTQWEQGDRWESEKEDFVPLGPFKQEEVLCKIVGFAGSHALWGDAGCQKVWDFINEIEEFALLNDNVLHTLETELQEEYLDDTIVSEVIHAMEEAEIPLPDNIEKRIKKEARQVIKELEAEFCYWATSTVLGEELKVLAVLKRRFIDG